MVHFFRFDCKVMEVDQTHVGFGLGQNLFNANIDKISINQSISYANKKLQRPVLDVLDAVLPGSRVLIGFLFTKCALVAL